MVGNDFFDRLVYKKNAISLLQDIIINEFPTAKILFISSRQAYYKYGAFVINELEATKCAYATVIRSSIFDKIDVEKISKQYKDSDLIISLGGGNITDLARIVAKIVDAKHIVIASNPTTTAYFSKYSFVDFKNLKKCFKCDFPYKIIIDEMIISSASDYAISCGRNFVASFWEMYFTLETNRLLFNMPFDTSQLKMILSKFKDNIEYLYSNTQDSKLVLMDILVDLAFATRNFSLFESGNLSFAFLLEKSRAITECSFGDLCLIGQRIMFEHYNKFLLQKRLEVITMPDFELVARNLHSLKISAKEVKLLQVKRAYESKKIYQRLNMVKNQLLCLCGNVKEELSELKVKKNVVVDIDKCFTALNLISFLYDTPPLISIMASTGLMNF